MRAKVARIVSLTSADEDEAEALRLVGEHAAPVGMHFIYDDTTQTIVEPAFLYMYSMFGPDGRIEAIDGERRRTPATNRSKAFELAEWLRFLDFTKRRWDRADHELIAVYAHHLSTNVSAHSHKRRGRPTISHKLSTVYGFYNFTNAAGTLAEHMKDFVVRWAGVADLDGTDERLREYVRTAGRCISSRQWRKTWANFVIRTDPRLLPAISQQFQHISTISPTSAPGSTAALAGRRSSAACKCLGGLDETVGTQAGDGRMTVIASYFYKDGERVREVALDERVLLDDDRSGFCWIGISEPAREELEALQATYRLHPLAVDNAFHPLCPPKLEVYNEELFVVAQTAELVDDRIRYGKTAIFTGHNHIISVRHGSGGAHGNLRQQLEDSPALLGQGVGYVLHAILHRVVDQYLPIFEMIEDDVLEMERRSLDDFLHRSDVARIFGLRCQLTRFQRTLGAMAELVRKLARGHFPCISPEVRPYFNDVADHVTRVQTMVDGLLHVLATVFEFSSLLEQQRIGVITRQLAAWAGILAVPTAIAGIYGMNFRYMPELEQRYGYFTVVGLMGLLCLFLFVRFKRAKWI